MKLILLVLTITAFPAIAADPGSDRLIQFYQDHVLRDDTDFANYDRLGSAYLQKARETGDTVYYNLSEKAFTRALSLTAGTPDRGSYSTSGRAGPRRAPLRRGPCPG